jgi:hypothetical protein
MPWSTFVDGVRLIKTAVAGRSRGMPLVQSPKRDWKSAMSAVLRGDHLGATASGHFLLQISVEYFALMAAHYRLAAQAAENGRLGMNSELGRQRFCFFVDENLRSFAADHKSIFSGRRM